MRPHGSVDPHGAKRAYAASVPKAPALTLGLSWSGEGYEQNPDDWEAIRHSGTSIYRLQIDKGLVDRWGWQVHEEAFRLAWERGVRILPFLYGWNNGSQTFPTQDEYGAWKSWVEQVVARFGVGGTFWQDRANPLPPTAWEIWNEPNFAPNNPGGVKVQPENYARFLKESASGVWTAQPSPPADVMLGGLLSGVDEDSSRMKVRKFIEKVDRVPEMGLFFNQVSLHPFGFAGGVKRVERFIKEARLALDDVFSHSKKIAVTEMGWAVKPSELGVDESEQARLLTNTFNTVKANRDAWGVSMLLWYFYRDTNGSAWPANCGLRAKDGLFRPSWYAFQAQTSAPAWPPSPTDA